MRNEEASSIAWLEKTGRTAANDDHQGMDDPRFWGTLLEPYVAVAYQQKTDQKVRKVNAVLQHPTFPFMLANIDREVVGSADVQILECKTAGEFGSRLWKDGVPEYVQLQVQHQLAVTGKGAAEVAVLLCGQKLEVHRIERDEEVISRLVVLESQFWEYVVTDTPPPADGSESAARALRHLYQGNDTTLDFTGNAELGSTFDSLADLDQEIASKERDAERLKQTIQQAMGDASKAAFANGVVTFKRAKDGSRIDKKALAVARFNAVIGDGEEDALGSFVLRTTSFNTIRTLAARLQYFSAVSGRRLACMPLELKLRGKSTAMSHRTAIYYVDLVVRSGMTLEQAIAEAQATDAQREDSGFDQEALDEAARRGFANGAFEDLAEDVPAVVEEFYPDSGQPESAEPPAMATSLRGRLEQKVVKMGNG